jgi:ribosome-binding protein aMBF1 (putative translation factor)
VMTLAQPDELDELISSRSSRNPAFTDMVDQALRAREVLRELTQARIDQGLSQTVVAARMGSSQSVVARIERGDRDVRLSTLARYAAAVGRRVDWSVSKAKAG